MKGFLVLLLAFLSSLATFLLLMFIYGSFYGWTILEAVTRVSIANVMMGMGEEYYSPILKVQAAIGFACFVGSLLVGIMIYQIMMGILETQLVLSNAEFVLGRLEEITARTTVNGCDLKTDGIQLRIDFPQGRKMKTSVISLPFRGNSHVRNFINCRDLAASLREMEFSEEDVDTIFKWLSSVTEFEDFRQ